MQTNHNLSVRRDVFKNVIRPLGSVTKLVYFNSQQGGKLERESSDSLWYVFVVMAEATV